MSSRLDLLGTPASVGFSHVLRRLDGGDELESDVANTDDADDATSEVVQEVSPEEKAAEEDVQDTTANEREEEVGVARNLGRDLELEEGNGKTKGDHVRANDDGGEAEISKDVVDTTKSGDGGDNQVDDAEDIGELHCDGLASGQKYFGTNKPNRVV